MIRRILVVLMCVFSLSAFSAQCPKAKATDSGEFCSTFKTAAICYCTSSGLPSFMCQDMKLLYGRLISVFGSLKSVCEYQKNTTTQDCIDNWNCYMNGGVDSQGRLCSGTKQPCE